MAIMLLNPFYFKYDFYYFTLADVIWHFSLMEDVLDQKGLNPSQSEYDLYYMYFILASAR